ncbi:Na+/H+ antiporter subunit E [Halostella pelagica]|uniref:Na+/H+ antiporter subunit E n=1 Tax=Halostella pelagica TaxID=2583824 RepID=UPI00108062CC|nr:Na+/H+ antiporter subunit E [Halostella pelagica]
MTRRWPVVGVLFGVLWLFVRGVELAVDAVLGQFLLGLGVGLPIAYVFRRLYDDTVDLGRTTRAVPYVALYVSAFLKEVVVANVDVAYRVLDPSLPIEPEVILIPLRVETDLGVTTIANSITITPGTITLDYDSEANALYVHVIDGRDPQGIVEPIREWEDYALVIFDEERTPADPAPEIAVYPAGESGPPSTASEIVQEDWDGPRQETDADGTDRDGDEGDGGEDRGR